MRTEPRIRPRTWLAKGRSPRRTLAAPRLRWLPLSLIFRRQRPQPRTPVTPPRPPATTVPIQSGVMPPAPSPRLERHVHYHTRQGAQLFSQYRPEHRFVFVKNRTQTAMPLAKVPEPVRFPGQPEFRHQTEDSAIRQEHTLIQERFTNTLLQRHECIQSRDRFFSSRSILRTRMAERQIETASRMRDDRQPPAAGSQATPFHRPFHAVRTEFRRQDIVSPREFASGMHAGRTPAAPLRPSISPPPQTVIEHRLARPMSRDEEASGERPIRSLLAAALEGNPVPMVWRQSSRAEASADAGAALQPGETGGLRSTAPAAATASAPRSPKTAGGAAPAPAALTFDALVMDRLAEDVLRRIERRVRIERERRGM